MNHWYHCLLCDRCSLALSFPSWAIGTIGTIDIIRTIVYLDIDIGTIFYFLPSRHKCLLCGCFFNLQMPMNCIYLDCQKSCWHSTTQETSNKSKGVWIHRELSLLNKTSFDRLNIKSYYKTTFKFRIGSRISSVIGPTLSLTHIENITELKNIIIKLFTDNEKKYKKIRNKNDKEQLKSDLYKISVWSDIWD